MKVRPSYKSTGLFLTSFGALLALISYLLIQNIPLTSLGIGVAIIGAAALLLPPNPVPRSIVREMIKNSATNIEALLEEFDVKGRAVYLPPRDGYVTAFVTLEESQGEVISSPELPMRVLSIAQGAKGIMIFPPGSELPKVQDSSESTYEHLLSSILVDAAELVGSVKAVENAETVNVEISKPKIHLQLPRFNRCLGSLPSSIAACTLAFKTKSRVTIESEQASDERILLRLKIHQEWDE